MSVPPGWLSDEEAECLRALALGKTVLELGAWTGRPTVELAAAAAHVVSVDWHKGRKQAAFGDALPGYWDQVRHLDNVTIVVGRFESIVPLFAPVFDLTLVDGAHDHDSVVRNTRLAVSVTRGTVVFHDFDRNDVRAAVAEAGVTPTRLVGTLAMWETA